MDGGMTGKAIPRGLTVELELLLARKGKSQPSGGQESRNVRATRWVKRSRGQIKHGKAPAPCMDTVDIKKS